MSQVTKGHVLLDFHAFSKELSIIRRAIVPNTFQLPNAPIDELIDSFLRGHCTVSARVESDAARLPEGHDISLVEAYTNVRYIRFALAGVIFEPSVKPDLD